MINKMAIERLKSETRIGDVYGVYYHGTILKDYVEIVKFNDKSVWHKTSWMTDRGMVESTSRESWNTILQYIEKGVYRKV